MSTTEQFETWLSLKYGGSRLGMWMKENGEYGVPSVQLCWEAWQASRAAIELELPKTFPGEYNTLVMYVDDVESSLESAGIKVKE